MEATTHFNQEATKKQKTSIFFAVGCKQRANYTGADVCFFVFLDIRNAVLLKYRMNSKDVKVAGISER